MPSNNATSSGYVKKYGESLNHSRCWEYFLFRKDNETAKCNLCGEIKKAKGSSTKGLLVHLKSKHKIVFASTRTTSAPKARKEPPITRTLKAKPAAPIRSPLNEMIAQLCAVDGLSFNTLAKSDILHQLFRLNKTPLPSCANTIKGLLMDYYKAAKSNVIEEIKNLIRNGEKFSVTLDEYLSIRNKRYLIVNLRALEKLYCLGTITITGSVSTERVTEILVEKMEEFEINLKTDIIAVVSDGDSAMVTLGQNIDALHLLCLAHGMHLAVCDVLYYNQKKLDECENSDDDEEPTETDEEYAEFKMDLVKKANHFPVMYQRHIKLVRKYCFVLKRFPLKNDKLQQFISETFGKGANLVRDCKTRWTSLKTMLSKFIECSAEIEKTLAALKIPNELSEQDRIEIKDLCSALEVFEVAVNTLCRRDIDLFKADKTLEFSVDALRALNTSIASDLLHALLVRINERRISTLMHLVRYMNDEEYIREGTDYMGYSIVKKNIMELAVNLSSRLFGVRNKNGDGGAPGCSSSMAINSSQNGNNERDISFSEKIELMLNSKNSVRSNRNSEVDYKVIPEMHLNEETQEVVVDMDKLLRSIKTIPPTSVESERVSSAFSFFYATLRTRMNDSTINALTFLRAYFKFH